jgi:hypothetical protein
VIAKRSVTAVPKPSRAEPPSDENRPIGSFIFLATEWQNELAKALADFCSLRKSHYPIDMSEFMKNIPSPASSRSSLHRYEEADNSPKPSSQTIRRYPTRRNRKSPSRFSIYYCKS